MEFSRSTFLGLIGGSWYEPLAEAKIFRAFTSDWGRTYKLCVGVLGVLLIYSQLFWNVAKIPQVM